MNLKKVSLLIVLLLVADQALKIWIKTHLCLDEAITVFPDWFQLRFIENNGAAFGMHIASRGGFDWGKLLLGLFRLAMAGAIGWGLVRLVRRGDAPRGVIVGAAMILAGAVGNILDSALYGVLFSESTPMTVARFGGSYAPPMMGKVVDMFYFPLFRWEGVPRLLSFLVDGRGYFFGAIFNLADAYISVAVVYLILFQRRFFNSADSVF
ncbi:signal peptidase II [Alistipes sp.]|uniref:signal peptidase II n=1 Tax=Alistipes sp. TaxID=1872444 RepID=UPI000E81AFB1|nr:signal peptidase II [Alistipes sp.]HBX90699.1 peptidase [Alistipes sp.]HCN13615.1 peptidase [Alistipes sp.]